MSVTDLVLIVHDLNYALPFHLVRGRETFFDDDYYQRRWETWEAARDWARVNLGVDPVEPMRQERLL